MSDENRWLKFDDDGEEEEEVFWRRVHADAGGGLDGVLNAEPAPLEPALPDEGWVAESVGRLTEGSMIPPEFALFTSLAAVAAAGQGVRVWRLGPNEWGTGLWVVCLAAAGGRKTSALAGFRPLEELLPFNRLQTSTTSEALTEAFEGTPDRWMAVPEFSALMNENEKSYMYGVRDALNGTWDGGRYQSGDKRRVGGKVTELPKYATTTIIGMATMSHFSEWAATSAIQQGFLTRVVLVPQSTEVGYAGLRDATNIDTRELYNGLKKIREETRKKPKGITNDGRPLVSFEHEAIDALDAYDKLWTTREDLPPALDGFAKRLMPNAVRVAYAHSLARSGSSVSVADVRLAVALMEYSRTRAWPLIHRYHGARGWQGKNLVRLEGALDRLAQSSLGGWVTKRALMRATHLFGTSFDEAVGFFVETEQWEVDVTQRPGRGGAAQVRFRRVPLARSRSSSS